MAPSMPFMGVRISWLMLDKNASLVRAAARASSRAVTSSRVRLATRSSKSTFIAASAVLARSSLRALISAEVTSFMRARSASSAAAWAFNAETTNCSFASRNCPLKPSAINCAFASCSCRFSPASTRRAWPSCKRVAVSLRCVLARATGSVRGPVHRHPSLAGRIRSRSRSAPLACRHQRPAQCGQDRGLQLGRRGIAAPGVALSLSVGFLSMTARSAQTLVVAINTRD